MSSPLSFLASDFHLATRNPKFWTEMDPKCDKDLFWSSPEFEAKFWTEIELLSLTKLLKNISPP